MTPMQQAYYDQEIKKAQTAFEAADYARKSYVAFITEKGLANEFVRWERQTQKEAQPSREARPGQS